MKQALKIIGIIELVCGGIGGLVTLIGGSVAIGVAIIISALISGLIFLSISSILDGVEENKASLEEIKNTLKNISSATYRSDDEIKMEIKNTLAKTEQLLNMINIGAVINMENNTTTKSIDCSERQEPILQTKNAQAKPESVEDEQKRQLLREKEERERDEKANLVRERSDLQLKLAGCKGIFGDKKRAEEIEKRLKEIDRRLNR